MVLTLGLKGKHVNRLEQVCNIIIIVVVVVVNKNIDNIHDQSIY